MEGILFASPLKFLPVLFQNSAVFLVPQNF